MPKQNGRNYEETLFAMYGYSTKQGGVTLTGTGWVTDASAVSTNSGTVISYGGVNNENDGISSFLGHIYGDSAGVARSYTMTRASGNTIMFMNNISYPLYPLASPIITGNVYLDTDGSTNINGVGTNAGGLYVNVIDSNNNLIYSAVVDAIGNFTIPNRYVLERRTYNLQLSKNTGTIGNIAPIKELPDGWSIVGESKNTTGNDGSADGVINSTVNATDITGLRYGIVTIPCGNVDSDGDGIADDCDLDDDNDGILDLNECSTDMGILLWWSYNDSTRNAGTNAASSLVIASAVASTNDIGVSVTNPTAAANYLRITGVDATTLNSAVSNNEYVQYTFTTANWAAGTHYYYEKTSLDNKAASPNYNLSIAITNNAFSTSGTYLIKDLGMGSSYAAGATLYNNITPYLLQPNTTYTVRVYFYNVTGGSSATILHDDYRLLFRSFCDTDNDGNPDYLDLDSDNDGCLDAIEGGANVATSQLVNSGGVLSVGTGSTATNRNLCAGSSCVDANGIPNIVGASGQTVGDAQNASVNSQCSSTFCYKPGVLDAGNTYPTKHGITALGRAGADNGNWPMLRQSAWTVLEAKTKGFVVNRVKFNSSNQPVADDGTTLVITNPVEGMMVYDITNNCLKVYTSNNGGSTFAWHCMSTQACPQ